jgi:4-amino-4-deoxy-L-arabinose transferase-like glycosyltransferase
VTLADASVDTAADEQEPGPVGPASARGLSDPEAQFRLGVACAVVLGAAVRFVYLFHGAQSVWGDGFDYHLSALRLADGLGYTEALGDAGAETAHHPPGWVTVLAAVTEAGGRSMWAHQVTGLVIGLGVIAIAGLVGRRYVGRRVGVVAAFAAAVYPGFWVLDVQILSEPLGLFIAGLVMLVLAELWDRPTLARAVLAGAVCGVLALVRSEQLALLVIAIAPLLLLNRRIDVRRRLAYTGSAALATVVLITPWTVYNLGRFEEPVVLSSNAGSTLLSGNCPGGGTYDGGRMGSFHVACTVIRAQGNPDLDRSQLDIVFRDTALDNMRDNVDRLPATVMARYGRLLGVFRPAQTVDIVATWLGSAHWPVWAWVTSFWALAPLAVYGGVRLRRSRTFQWPLVAPVAIVVLVTAVAFGDPRYHVAADLGTVVLAAVAVDHLVRRRRRRAQT